MKPVTLVTLVASSLVGSIQLAAAETSVEKTSDTPRAIERALEISLGGSFLQNEGSLGGRMARLRDVAGPGAGLDLAVSYRATRRFAFGAYGSLAGFSEASDDGTGNAGSWSAGLKVDWHLAPASQADPWISAGAGVKMLYVDEAGEGDRRMFGVELARLQVGMDYRLTPSLSLGPTLGASVTMFTSERAPGRGEYDEIEDKDLAWTFAAGILGRFDLFGTTR